MIDRATHRTIIAYNFTNRFKAGVEINPKADEVGVVANFRAIDETEQRPAIILGTSSDRIGTPDGRSYYVTASKSLRAGRFLFAPYVGASYSSYEERVIFPWGVNVPLGRGFSTMIMNDGVHTHLSGTYARGAMSVTLLAVEREHLGVTVGFAF